MRHKAEENTIIIGTYNSKEDKKSFRVYIESLGLKLITSFHEHELSQNIFISGGQVTCLSIY